MKLDSEKQLTVHNYPQGWCNWAQPKKTPGCFKKAHLIQTNETHYKSHSFLFLWKIYYEVKSEIINTLVQLTVIFLMKQTNSNEIWRTWKMRRKIRTVGVNSTGYLLQLCKSVYFNKFFCLLCIQTVSDVGPYQTICWKILYRCWSSRACTKLTWNCSVCVRVAFLRLLCACLPNLTTLEWIDQQHFAKSKMGYISLPSNLNAIIGITSYYCVMLKMVILHDALKTIQNRVFMFFLKKEQKPVSFQKTQKRY